MNMNDIQYIAEIARQGSINKAAKELFVSQPSLSKCIHKIEKEFDIEIFRRSKGSTVKLTEDGGYFVEMAERMLEARKRFEEKVEKHRSRSRSAIVFGTTRQRSYDVMGDVLKFLYENHKEYFVEMKTGNTGGLKQELLEGSLDMILINESREEGRFYYEHILPTWQLIYLRKGSPAAQKAVKMEGCPYPVLRLEDLAGEVIVTNEAGNGNRDWLERMQKKLNLKFTIEKVAGHHNRMVMVENGRATYVFRGEGIGLHHHIDRSLVYFIHPEQNTRGNVCLICRRGYEKDIRFQIMAECMHCLYKMEN